MFTLNVPAGERLIRALLGVALATCGWFCFAEPNVLFVAAGACLALTGFVGFCPACALAGRRLKAKG